MRVVIADPPAFTPAYDHELAAALARAGADVDLVTSRFRFGAVAEPAGYRRRELFYPLSSRVFQRSRLRLPVKAVEHPLGLARLAALRADVVHVQWLATPELDALAAPPSRAARADGTRPAAAADGAQGRTVAAHVRPLRADRRPLRARAADARRVRRPGREASRHPPPRRFRATRSGATTGAPCSRSEWCGPTSRSSTRPRQPARQERGCSSPVTRLSRCPLSTVRSCGSAISRRPSSSVRSATPPSPSSRTAPSSTRAARCCRRSAPACLRSSTTSAVSAKRSRAYGAGRVVPPDDVAALGNAVRELLDDESALAEARAGALRAREAALVGRLRAAHLELYGELA